MLFCTENTDWSLKLFYGNTFAGLIDTLNINKVKLTTKLDIEIQKFKKLQAMFLGKKKTEKIEPIDLKDYTKFVLKEGSPLEQRSILECISSELVLKNKIIKIT